jgi:Flp pilus assembly protein TadD
VTMDLGPGESGLRPRRPDEPDTRNEARSRLSGHPQNRPLMYDAGAEKRRMSTSIEDLTARAKTLIAERNYHEAVRACRRVLLSQPTLLEVRILLGMSLLALRRHDEARAEMLAVLRREPNDATAHRLLGEAYLRDGQTDKATESLKKALELAPDDAQAKDLLAETADEDKPQLATVDRWFDPEAVATVQSDVPPLFEDDTSIAARDLPRIIADLKNAPIDELQGSPTVQVDPSLIAPQPSPEPLAIAPVRFEAHTETVPQRGKIPSVAARESRPDPIPVAAMPMSPELPSDQTGAHTPTAKRAPTSAPSLPTYVKPKPSNGTDELDLGDIEAIEASARTAAPDRRKIPSLKQTMMGLDRPYSTEPFRDDLPTGSSDPPIFEDDTGENEIDPVQTRARAPNGDGAGLYVIPELRVVKYEPAPNLHPRVPPVMAPRAAPVDPLDLDPFESSPTSAIDAGLSPFEAEPTSARLVGTGTDPDDEMVGEDTIARQAPLFPAYERTPAGVTREQRGAPEPPAKPRAAQSSAPKLALPKISLDALPKWVPKGPMRWVALGAVALVPIALVLVIVLVVAVVDGQAETEIEGAVSAADVDGLPGSLTQAITLVEEHDGDDAEDVALRARLLAVRVLEYRDNDRGVEVNSLIEQLDDDERRLVDARIASAYMALAEGRVAEARQLLRDVETEEPSAELAYARGLAEAYAGEYDRAAANLRTATNAHPAAPRYVSLTALVTALAGDATTAARLLDSVPNGAMAPAIRIARARVLFESGRDPALAVE